MPPIDTNTAWPEPLTRGLLRAYRAADAALVEGLTRSGHPGVGAAQWELVARIGTAGARAADLARQLGTSKQAIAQAIQGRALHRRGLDASERVEERLRRALGATRLKALKHTLDELSGTLDAE